jgi:hypothetical protein
MWRLVLTLAIALPSAGVTAQSEQDATRMALESLTQETGLSRETIEVVSAQPVEWADANLGCPSETSVPPQATPGYRVLLRSAGNLYVVNVAGARTARCVKALAVAGAPQEVGTMSQESEPTDPASQALIANAREDLIRRLSVSPDDIAFVAFKSVVWPDGSLGCPRPGMVYPQVQRDGFLIQFAVGGRTYNYHGGSGRDPFLCETAENPPQ